MQYVVRPSPRCTIDTKRLQLPYVYSPLPANSIRLLLLLPAVNPDAPLHCELIHRPLSTTARLDYFEALSYVWGSADKPHTLTIQPNHSLPITTSLHAALLQLRDGWVARPLWIDAVCINQADLVERSAQVRLMAEIYFRASRVIVWLGEAIDNGDVALDDLRAMAAEEAERARGERAVEGPDHDSDNASATSDSDDASAKAVEDARDAAILALLRRPWFRRVWVIPTLHRRVSYFQGELTSAIPWHRSYKKLQQRATF